MKLFLAHGVPLPQALRFTATGLHEGYYSPACLRMAAEVEQGQSLSAAAFPGLPPTLAPMLEWGERTNALPEAFRAAAEAYEGRAELRGAMVESLITPIFLITFLILACTWILGLLLPMISLIQSLTGGGK
jgi:type II secretory pathway component PulF